MSSCWGYENDMIHIGIVDGRPLTIDVKKLWATRLLVQGISGSHKTSMLETVIKRIDREFNLENGYNLQKIVIDWEGEYPSRLRGDADYIIIGNKGDFPATLDTAYNLGKAVRQMYISAIIDISSFNSIKDREVFVRDFIRAFLDTDERQYRKPCLFVIDEAHNLAPQSRTAESSDAMRILVETGRKRSILPILATQRIAEIDKDVSAQLANRIIGLTVELSDRERAVKMLGLGQSEIDKLARLEAGQFYAFGLAMSDHAVRFTLDNEKPVDDYEQIPDISPEYIEHVRVLRDRVKITPKSEDAIQKNEIIKLRMLVNELKRNSVTDIKLDSVKKGEYARGWNDAFEYFKSFTHSQKSGFFLWKNKPIEFIRKKINGMSVYSIKDEGN